MSRYAQARRRNPRYREIPKFLEEFVEDESEKKRKDEELTGKHWLIFVVASCVVVIVSIYLQKSLPRPLEPNEGWIFIGMFNQLYPVPLQWRREGRAHGNYKGMLYKKV